MSGDGDSSSLMLEGGPSSPFIFLFTPRSMFSKSSDPCLVTTVHQGLKVFACPFIIMLMREKESVPQGSWQDRMCSPHLLVFSRDSGSLAPEMCSEGACVYHIPMRTCGQVALQWGMPNPERVPPVLQARQTSCLFLLSLKCVYSSPLRQYLM